MSTTSGRSDSIALTASRPSAASPTTSMSSKSARNSRRPRRTMAWSSTSSTRVREGTLDRWADAVGARVRCGGDRARGHRPVTSSPASARLGVAISRRRVPRRIPVNGTRISRNTSIETRKPTNRNTTPRNLPERGTARWTRSGSSESVMVGKNAPIAIRIVAGTRLWIRPVSERARRARERRDEVHDDRDRGDQQVEQELVAGLVGVERVRQHASLGHEHVGREHGAEDAAQTSP